MDFARHSGPLFFAHALQASGERAQLVEGLLQSLFRSLALRYVHDHAISFNDLPSLVRNGIHYVVDVLDRTIRKNNSIVHGVIPRLRWRILKPLLDSRSIFGMDPWQERFGHRGCRPGWIEAKDAK